ncbi:MAG: PadR family transcriptional regulator [Ruminococcus sp.]|nr:PadR family transcriptional regulator [Ruminococcus sp.]
MEKGQMKKGILELCILQIVSQRDMYGYEIMKTVTEAFSGLNESTVYAVLRRLHADRFTESYTGDISGGPKRKYYRITPAGEAALEDMRREWAELLAAANKILPPDRL